MNKTYDTFSFLIGILIGGLCVFLASGLYFSSQNITEPNNNGINMNNACNMAYYKNMNMVFINIAKDQLIYDMRLNRVDTTFYNKMRFYSNSHWGKSPEKYILSSEERQSILKNIKSTNDEYLKSIRYLYCNTKQDSLAIQDTSLVSTKLYKLWTKE